MPHFNSTRIQKLHKNTHTHTDTHAQSFVGIVAHSLGIDFDSQIEDAALFDDGGGVAGQSVDGRRRRRRRRDVAGGGGGGSGADVGPVGRRRDASAGMERRLRRRRLRRRRRGGGVVEQRRRAVGAVEREIGRRQAQTQDVRIQRQQMAPQVGRRVVLRMLRMQLTQALLQVRRRHRRVQ